MDGPTYGRAFANMGIALIAFGITLGFLMLGIGLGAVFLISHLSIGWH